ncbi:MULTISPECIES: EamA family transporter [unclassified Streptomyces]|uniref:DMT family transporter n=1 Tax=unclassified Streptomyces TaxID=2593676 RepID=UPI000F4D7500|nr:MULTISPECIES: EamA family transporter [unclassified Streptomyces]MDH6455313.1 drug/metabolite transporter (DMT)-like permease [Streptomyces sp. SAI-119]MDH6494134.1 drug/metabolite transporter (DMT)-like permease [Streptomyces sp. SAI-149]QUC58678.1 EamA family transporter [Streptomyces sp. A2-16]
MSRRGLWLFLITSVLWGVPYLLISVALKSMGPFSVVAGRVALGALVLLPVAWRRGLPRLLRERWRPLLLLAVVEVAVPFTLIAWGEHTVSSGLTGVLIATEPLFILALGVFRGNRERLARGAWGGVLLGFLGVVVLLGVADAGAGAVLVLAGAACYAGGAVLMHRLFPDVPPLTVSAGMLTLAAGPLLAIAAFFEPVPHVTAQASFAVLGLGVACTAGGFTAFFALIATEGPARAAFITYVAPIVAVASGVLLLSEPVTSRTIAGIVLILAGAALAARRPHNDTHAADTAEAQPFHTDITTVAANEQTGHVR